MIKLIMIVLMAIAFVSFVGVGIYTVLGIWIGITEVLPRSSSFKGTYGERRRQVLECIPKPIRRFGNICIAIFLACLVLLAILSLLHPK
jgi:hypothetical protein